MKFKKILYPIGAIGTATAPIATVISCGESIRDFNLLPTYTGQADQMIALGIESDYYPRQLDKKIFEYLLNPQKYMLGQDDVFKAKFAKKVAKMMPSTIGESWWNQDAKNSADKRTSNSYWQKQRGNVLLYEHYLLDDSIKIVQKSWAPKHKKETAIQTNFRSSRDPFTRLPKSIFFGWDLSNKVLNKIANDESISADDVTEQPNGDESLGNINASGEKLEPSKYRLKNNKLTVILDQVRNIGKEAEINKENAKLIIKLREVRYDFVNNNKTEAEWIYNDWFFVDSFHRMFLDNIDFQNSSFSKWIVDSTQDSPYSTPVDQDQHQGIDVDASIKALFDASTYAENEVKNEVKPNSTSTPKGSSSNKVIVLAHHPIYEQQGGEIGAAPMFEGAMRDNQLYLFNVAWQLTNLAKYGTPYGKQYYDIQDTNGKKDFDNVKAWVASHVEPNQLSEMKLAFDRANDITDQLYTRMTKIKDYFKDLGLNGKTFGLATIAPGRGVSTIQSMSKYSFLYKELGFAQPLPSNIENLKNGADEFRTGWQQNNTNKFMINEDGARVIKGNVSDNMKAAVGDDAIFNMDDNGWFWNIGPKGALSIEKLDKFKDSFDLGVIAGSSDRTNINSEVKTNNAVKNVLTNIFKGSSRKSDTILADVTEPNGSFVDYDLWNEGIKTPFVMHMVLDQVIKVSEDYVRLQTGGEAKLTSAQAKRADALNWGKYFRKDYAGMS